MNLLYKPMRFVRSPRLLVWTSQVFLFVISGLLAFLLRFDFILSDRAITQMLCVIPVWVCVEILVFRILDIDRSWWNYFSVPDLVRLSHGGLISFLVSTPIILYLGPDGFPRSLYFLNVLIACGSMALMRSCPRVLLSNLTWRGKRVGKCIVIYGAGQAGVMLLSELRKNPALGYRVCGFIDDDRRKVGMSIQTLRVLGFGSDLASLAKRYGIADVLIAIPSASGAEMTKILEHCHASNLPCKTIPGLSEVIQNRNLMVQVRDVSVEDLLGRNPVHLDQHAIRMKLTGSVVLVTGAGGSIGSELCRQIARFNPLGIVGYEIAETPLFEIDRELGNSFPKVAFFPEIGSIQNVQRFTEVLKKHSPSIIYHAAAYKHVPLMESHLFEAVENNVLGTRNVAIAAANHGVSSFVMISSDKAVRPCNIMGTTKRVAELLINSIRSSSTNFVSVRFGNVLGSNGSVIPIFKRQIAAGGPVTVTNSEMRRFFMTIPEAVQLVLQASTMGHCGDIFVLDMGQPIRIVDLARKLILLTGLKPDQDIEIRFTGVRPGEKLYEELSHLEEGTQPTYHEKIRIFSHGIGLQGGLNDGLDRLKDLCAHRNGRGLVLELKNIVPEYNPSADILRFLLEDKLDPVHKNSMAAHAGAAETISVLEVSS
ncbi:MAG: polysaccharide biosynthesis protein [Acidobacteriota bacterium]|nr:polysaccharide biosynthesis protein [Acidobacteriota bacterium]